jgi:hypothetical protein
MIRRNAHKQEIIEDDENEIVRSKRELKDEGIKVKEDGLNYFINDKDAAPTKEAKYLNKVKNSY